MTDKIVNYTPEQTAQLVANYKAGATVEALATMFGKTTRSVVAKLSREGVYTAKSKASGVARVKKADLVDAELSQIFVCINYHDEFFEFDDVPF